MKHRYLSFEIIFYSRVITYETGRIVWAGLVWQGGGGGSGWRDDVYPYIIAAINNVVNSRPRWRGREPSPPPRYPRSIWYLNDGCWICIALATVVPRYRDIERRHGDALVTLTRESVNDGGERVLTREWRGNYTRKNSVAVTINASRNFASRVARSLRLFLPFLFLASRNRRGDEGASSPSLLGNVASPRAFNSRSMDIAVNANVGNWDEFFFFFFSFVSFKRGV